MGRKVLTAKNGLASLKCYRIGCLCLGRQVFPLQPARILSAMSYPGFFCFNSPPLIFFSPYIPTNLNFSDMMTKALVPKKHREGVDLIINDKDAYRIVTARHEMTDDKYEASYFIIQDGDSDGLYQEDKTYNANSSPCVRCTGMFKGEGGDGSPSSLRQWSQAR
jgi:hypothetical protein